MHSFFRDRGAKLRPHVAAHGSPAIAHMQLAAGGTVGGITTTTLGQAEVFAANGLNDIVVANVLVTPVKIARLCALARRASVTVAVDSVRNVEDISSAAAANGVFIGALVSVNIGRNSTGVEPGGPTVALAKAVEAANGVRFAGLMTHDSPTLEDNEEFRRRIQRVLDTREDLERAGIKVGTVSVGGTYNYEIAGDMDGVTEVPAGSYALMDEKYRSRRAQFANAARVMGSVTSIPEAGNVITDVGRKAINIDAGNPSLDGLPGARVRGLSAEHGGIDVDPALDHGLELGDRVWFIPWDITGCVNVHDYMHATRDGRLEAVWDLPARGRYR
jgi:3-hydroxy-D-aspartate aldolase